MYHPDHAHVDYVFEHAVRSPRCKVKVMATIQQLSVAHYHLVFTRPYVHRTCAAAKVSMHADCGGFLVAKIKLMTVT
jgi:hypothetical protein